MRLPLFAFLFASSLALQACTSSAEAPSEAERSSPTQGKLVPAELKAFEPLIGLSVPEATAWLKQHPTPGPGSGDLPVSEVRVVAIDGEPQPYTLDLQSGRINVEIRGGKISAIESVG